MYDEKFEFKRQKCFCISHFNDFENSRQKIFWCIFHDFFSQFRKLNFIDQIDDLIWGHFGAKIQIILILSGSIFGGFFPFFGFGRSFTHSFWDTGWSDMDALYILYENLEEISYILDDQERMSCFADLLCSEQAKSGHDNFFTFVIR